MNNLGAVLGWKFSPAEGITTKDNVITGWPSALGTKPTPEQLALWAIEYDARPVEIDPDDALDAAITASNNFGELKAALLGRTRGRK